MAALMNTLGQTADCIENPKGYCISIAENKFKTGELETLSARQLWALVYDMRRNAASRRKKAARTTEYTEDTEAGTRRECL